ncbi:branched-chain amino acid ABC transporter permease [Propionibacteriaceae bacterium Y1700]|uniref:branched-chain amino acid ABC transporter permease n=1 Tax=Microlunatus sp. Y1700 TaxID=3418487 RepID=UPI003DA70653
MRILDTAAAKLSRFDRLAMPLGIAGSLLLIISGFLSWCYDDRVLDDISIRFWPASLQLFAVVLGAIGLVLALTRGPLQRLLGNWLDVPSGLRTLGIGSIIFVIGSLVAITVEAGGLINANEGVWIALVSAIMITFAGLAMADRKLRPMHKATLPATVEILAIVALLAIMLFTVAFVLETSDAWVLVLLVAMLIIAALALTKAGVTSWLSHVGTKHRRVLVLGIIVVAFAFPFTQDGSDANMNIAANVLIFAATAIGLNIVVGLAGLLDLGYIAFLGTGAYVGAILSASAFSTVGFTPPFLVTMLIGACVAACLGLIIGSPTLRVSGDYLAIVTLAFGEIFRLAMFNLDGNNGPDLTNGPNGIPAIPDLKIGSFDFGEKHTILGVELGRAANYYMVLMLLILFIILVFVRLNNSRIGRGWVAIREDERAAEAMGVNVFGLKLLAFAGGAFLAGMAGTIKAHQDVQVSPDSYIFLESAFLLAAVVLGGMGTVAGVLLGAALLKFVPEKLRDFNEYRLMLFGLIMVIMMRFRPEGLVSSRRRQLEFHEDDEELAERIGEEVAVDAAETKEAKA